MEYNYVKIINASLNSAVGEAWRKTNSDKKYNGNFDPEWVNCVIET